MVRGVLPSLLGAEPAGIDVYNRTHERAVMLADRMGSAKLSAVTADQLDSGYDLVINGSSAALTGSSVDLPAGIVVAGSRCYDMVYGNDVTAFNRWCLAEARCEVADGLGMLVEQAALSFDIWFARRVETRPVIEAIRSRIAAQR